MPQEGLRQRRVSSYDDGYRSQERHDGRNISGKTVQGSASTRRRVLRADAPTLLDHGVRPCRTGSIAYRTGIRALLRDWGTACRKPGFSPCGRRLMRCAASQPGEGYVSAHTVSVDTYPSSGANFVRATLSHKGRKGG